MNPVDSVLPRYSLLRHIDAPDDPSGCHYDLLLEALRAPPPRACPLTPAAMPRPA